MSGVPLHHFTVRWADLDANRHMANVAYLNIAVDARLAAFHHLGFTVADFAAAGIGPVIRREEVEYHREMHLHDAGTVSTLIAGLSEDGTRFRIRNAFVRADGVRCAEVTALAGWLHLAERRLVAPPEGLLVAMRGLPRTDDFEVLRSSVRA